MVNWNLITLGVFILIIVVFVIFEYQFRLSEDEEKACKILCESENMVYKGGNDLGYGSKIGGCKVCYCEKIIPILCSD